MVLRARKQRYKIIVQQSTETVDSVGEPISAWSTYAARSAEVMPKGGNERFRFDQYNSDATIVFKLRYDSLTKNITTKMRVSYDSRIFNITSIVNVDEMNREIIIICTEET